MKVVFLFMVLGVFLSCVHEEKVLYEELTPREFSIRLANCPVAYLPLGTLEWHGDHLPLGSDGLQPLEFFKRLATVAGGIVLPMIFLGPDFYDSSYNSTADGRKYYGMDYFSYTLPNGKFAPEQLIGSAYWVPDSTFNLMMEAIMNQLSRAGFKIVVAHGHGPSTSSVSKQADTYMDKYGLKVINCWGNDSADFCFQCDHAASNETSIMMSVRPELVQMGNFPSDTAEWPLGIGGSDPRLHASRKLGNDIIDFEIEKMATRIRAELLSLQ